MKTLPLLGLLAVLATPAVLGAAAFEGKVHMTISDSHGRSHEMVQSLKEGFVRMDMTGTKGREVTAIMDLNKREMTILIPAQHMYLVRPMPDFTAQAAQPSVEGEYSFEKTSETATILGYPCTKYVAKSKDTTTELWVTDRLGRFMGFGNNAGPMAGRRPAPLPAWEKALAGKDFFPMRVVSHDSSGREGFRMETTAVEKQTLADSEFAAPADYRKFDLAGMMSGLPMNQ